MNWETILTMAGKLATETTSKYGPVAWDMLLWITRMDALSYLVPEIAIGLIALLYIRWYFKFNLPAMRSKMEADNATRDTKYFQKKTMDDYARFWVTLWPCVISFGISFIIFVLLLDFWRWVQLFYPELYLAKQLVDKVM